MVASTTAPKGNKRTSNDPKRKITGPVPIAPATSTSPPSTNGDGKVKTATRSKSGCMTCRIRRKKCDLERQGDSCRTCLRLRIECLGWGAKRPEALRDSNTVKECQNMIKIFLASNNMIKGSARSSAVPLNPGNSAAGNGSGILQTVHSSTPGSTSSSLAVSTGGVVGEGTPSYVNQPFLRFDNLRRRENQSTNEVTIVHSSGIPGSSSINNPLVHGSQQYRAIAPAPSYVQGYPKAKGHSSSGGRRSRKKNGDDDAYGSESDGDDGAGSFDEADMDPHHMEPPPPHMAVPFSHPPLPPPDAMHPYPPPPPMPHYYPPAPPPQHHPHPHHPMHHPPPPPPPPPASLPMPEQDWQYSAVNNRPKNLPYSISSTGPPPHHNMYHPPHPAPVAHPYAQSDVRSSQHVYDDDRKPNVLPPLQTTLVEEERAVADQLAQLQRDREREMEEIERRRSQGQADGPHPQPIMYSQPPRSPPDVYGYPPQPNDGSIRAPYDAPPHGHAIRGVPRLGGTDPSRQLLGPTGPMQPPQRTNSDSSTYMQASPPSPTNGTLSSPTASVIPSSGVRSRPGEGGRRGEGDGDLDGEPLPPNQAGQYPRRSAPVSSLPPSLPPKADQSD